MKTFYKALVRVVIISNFLFMLNSFVQTMLELFRPDNNGDYSDRTLFVILLIAIFLILTLILFILWRKTDWLVRLINGSTDSTEVNITTSNLDLMKVILKVFGIYLLISSIPDLAGLAGQHIQYYFSYNDAFMFMEEGAFTRQYMTYGFSIIIGLLLVTGKEKIAGIRNKITGFLVKAEPEDK